MPIAAIAITILAAALAMDEQRVAEIDREGSWAVAAAVAGAVLVGVFSMIVVLARWVARERVEQLEDR